MTAQGYINFKDNNGEDRRWYVEARYATFDDMLLHVIDARTKRGQGAWHEIKNLDPIYTELETLCTNHAKAEAKERALDI